MYESVEVSQGNDHEEDFVHLSSLLLLDDVGNVKRAAEGCATGRSQSLMIVIVLRINDSQRLLSFINAVLLVCCLTWVSESSGDGWLHL